MQANNLQGTVQRGYSLKLGFSPKGFSPESFSPRGFSPEGLLNITEVASKQFMRNSSERLFP